MADLTAPQLVTLATEINTDPKALTYLPASKNNIQIASIINTVGASVETVRAGLVTSAQVMGAILLSELAASLTTQPQLFQFLYYISSGFVDFSNTNVRAAMVSLFPVGTAPTTRTNFQNLVDRPASRAEVLFGAGQIISPWDVGRALVRPA